jgi:hypothetical protein
MTGAGKPLIGHLDRAAQMRAYQAEGFESLVVVDDECRNFRRWRARTFRVIACQSKVYYAGMTVLNLEADKSPSKAEPARLAFTNRPMKLRLEMGLSLDGMAFMAGAGLLLVRVLLAGAAHYRFESKSVTRCLRK